MISVNLGIGLCAGLAFASSILNGGVGVDPSSAPALPINPGAAPWVQHVAIIFASVPTCLLFKGAWEHLPYYAVGTCSAFYGTLFASTVLKAGSFSACVGAALCGTISNVYGHVSGASGGPAVELLLFSLIAIVPGSFSLSFSFAATGSKDESVAIALLGNFLFVAVAIVSGQFVANSVVSPRRQL